MLKIKSPLLKKVLTKISYWHYRRADGLIGVFKGMQDRFISEISYPEEKTLYIPQAPEKIYETRPKDDELSKRFEGTFNIAFAGNINPAQCFDIITKAAKIVKDRSDLQIRYIIVGEGMSKKWLEEEVKRLKIDDLFIFEGLKPVTDIPKYQYIADANIVALSKSDLFEYGIPAKVYSYLPSGKPIIGSMDGEGQKLINDMAQCGVCVDSGDIEGLANAIEELASADKQTLGMMGSRGMSYYQKHFEREKNLTRLEEFVLFDNPIPDQEYSQKGVE